MKRLTIDKTWELCLAMWRWIANERRKGNTAPIYYLKEEWAEKHDYSVDLHEECFFCEYGERGDNSGCRLCPGKKVDPDFDCEDRDYHFTLYPIAFYNKLVSLNRKRLKSK